MGLKVANALIAIVAGVGGAFLLYYALNKLTEMLPLKGAGFIKRVKRLAPYMKKYKANPPA